MCYKLRVVCRSWCVAFVVCLCDRWLLVVVCCVLFVFVVVYVRIVRCVWCVDCCSLFVVTWVPFVVVSLRAVRVLFIVP